MFEEVSAPPPAPPPDPNVSQNGKCGYQNNGKKCPPGQCCSNYGWCGGSSNSATPNDAYCSDKKFGYAPYHLSTLRDMYERGEIDSFKQGYQHGIYDGDPIPYRSTISEDTSGWDGFESFVG